MKTFSNGVGFGYPASARENTTRGNCGVHFFGGERIEWLARLTAAFSQTTCTSPFEKQYLRKIWRNDQPGRALYGRDVIG